MNNKCIILFLSTILYCTAQADTLVLKNGLFLQGKYKGGAETTIMFETSGSVQEVAILEIQSLTFSIPAGETAAGSTETQAAPTATVAAVTTTPEAVAETPAAAVKEIPAGTKMMIKTSEERQRILKFMGK